ncbi:MAG: guanylate kinase [Oscillospiraceae bacterium]|nr:guanylate kinase [Oscillospiraceae bacterium]MCL2278325.1 guanylate kinase [Oscillospiraceae bacterium]
MNINEKGNLVVISAPSGTGKGTVITQLLEKDPEFVFSISATTREPRPGEIDGVAYKFLSRERFVEMINEGKFLEYAEYVGNFYGTPVEPILECIETGKTIILDIEVLGAKQVMEKIPDALTIFIIPPSMEELEKRLRGRGTDSEDKLLARLKRAGDELEEKSRYKYIVVNDVVSRAVDEILSIIDTNKSKGLN